MKKKRDRLISRHVGRFFVVECGRIKKKKIENYPTRYLHSIYYYISRTTNDSFGFINVFIASV